MKCTMRDKLTKLIDVKSIVTIMIIGTFCYLSITGRIGGDVFMQVVMIIIGFFFASKTFGEGHPSLHSQSDDKDGSP